mgnify:CR=1 FL=1
MGKIIIVGTLAFDTIETPHGKVERVIGGSAPFASLAAKTKNIECAIVSIVGDDFPKAYLNSLSKKNIDISEIKIKKNGKKLCHKWNSVVVKPVVVNIEMSWKTPTKRISSLGILAVV